jgi:hypothetical protein
MQRIKKMGKGLSVIASLRALKDKNVGKIVTKGKDKSGAPYVNTYDGISNVGGSSLQIRGPVFNPIGALKKGLERYGFKKKIKKGKKGVK